MDHPRTNAISFSTDRKPGWLLNKCSAASEQHCPQVNFPEKKRAKKQVLRRQRHNERKLSPILLEGEGCRKR